MINKNNMSDVLEHLTDDPSFQVAMLEEGLIHRVALRVMRRRKALGMSQESLAERIGTKQPRVANIEAGEANVTLRVLAQLAFALECEPEEFVAEHPSYVSSTLSQQVLDDLWNASLLVDSDTTVSITSDAPASAIGAGNFWVQVSVDSSHGLAA